MRKIAEHQNEDTKEVSSTEVKEQPEIQVQVVSNEQLIHLKLDEILEWIRKQ